MVCRGWTNVFSPVWVGWDALHHAHAVCSGRKEATPMMPRNRKSTVAVTGQNENCSPRGIPSSLSTTAPHVIHYTTPHSEHHSSQHSPHCPLIMVSSGQCQVTSLSACVFPSFSSSYGPHFCCSLPKEKKRGPRRWEAECSQIKTKAQ